MQCAHLELIELYHHFLLLQTLYTLYVELYHFNTYSIFLFSES